MAESHHVGAGYRAVVLCESSQCSWPGSCLQPSCLINGLSPLETPVGPSSQNKSAHTASLQNKSAHTASRQNLPVSCSWAWFLLFLFHKEILHFLMKSYAFVFFSGYNLLLRLLPTNSLRIFLYLNAYSFKDTILNVFRNDLWRKASDCFPSTIHTI